MDLNRTSVSRDGLSSDDDLDSASCPRFRVSSLYILIVINLLCKFTVCFFFNIHIIIFAPQIDIECQKFSISILVSLLVCIFLNLYMWNDLGKLTIC